MTEADAAAKKQETLANISYSTDQAALVNADLIVEAIIEDLAIKVSLLVSDTTVALFCAHILLCPLVLDSFLRNSWTSGETRGNLRFQHFISTDHQNGARLWARGPFWCAHNTKHSRAAHGLSRRFTLTRPSVPPAHVPYHICAFTLPIHFIFDPPQPCSSSSYRWSNQHCGSRACLRRCLVFSILWTCDPLPVGVHYFNPVQLMRLTEVIRTEHTDEAVFALTKAWSDSLGKTSVCCGDTPGFIVNRLLVPALAQAVLMAERGDASVGDIDVSMQLGAGHPMGPIMLADYVGLDTTLSILKGWVAEFPGEPAFIVPKSLEAKVAKGRLGRKSGHGFYEWEGDKPVGPSTEPLF